MLSTKVSRLLEFFLLSVSLILFGRLLYFLIKQMREFNLNDFAVYYFAAGDASSKNPYIQKYFAPYNYPPSATLFFQILPLLPYKLAESLWLSISIFSLLLAVFLLFKLFFKQRIWVYAFFVSTLLLRTFPARFTLALGQINLIILIFIVLSFYFYQRGRKNLAGLFLGIAGALKLTPLTLSTFYLFKKEKKSLLIPFLFFATVNLISGILLGFENFFYYFKVVLPLLMQGDISRDIHVHYFNQSLAALLFDLKLASSWQSILRWLVAGSSVILVGRRLAKQNRPLENLKFFSLLLIIFCTFSPSFTWTHHYVFLFPALLALFFSLVEKPTVLKSLLSCLFLLSFTFYFKDSSSPQLLENVLLRSHTFFAAIGLFVTLLIM